VEVAASEEETAAEVTDVLLETKSIDRS